MINEELRTKINKFFILDTLKHWTNGTGEMDKDKLKCIVKERVKKFMKLVFGEEQGNQKRRRG